MRGMIESIAYGSISGLGRGCRSSTDSILEFVVVGLGV